jgi:hypothetical protein
LLKQAVAAFHEPNGGSDDHDQRQEANRQARPNSNRQPAPCVHRSTFSDVDPKKSRRPL